MESIYKDQTRLTPKMSFNANTGIFELSGRSMPEVAMNIYKPIIDWLDQYFLNPQKETQIIFRLSFFNTSSSKYIMEMLKKMENAYKRNISVKAVWYCEDEDLLDLANDYQALVKIPMEINKIEENGDE